jgi:AcrR family transcriptional regulator
MSSLAIRATKQERAARTRGEILEAAILVFSKHGFLGTSMVQLARTIRMTPGALYWHFATKEDLLLAALEELDGRFLREFEPIAREARTLRAHDQLAFFLQRTERFFGENPSYGRFLAMLAALSPGAHERVSKAISEVLEAYARAVGQIIRYGQEKTREFREDVDPRQVAHLLIGATCGLIVHQGLFASAIPYQGLAQTLERLTLRGLARAAPPGDPP